MKKFTKSIEYFEKIDQYDLTTEDQNEFLFKLGYSKFIRKKQDEAKVNFNELLQRESDYKEFQPHTIILILHMRKGNIKLH